MTNDPTAFVRAQVAPQFPAALPSQERDDWIDRNAQTLIDTTAFEKIFGEPLYMPEMD